MVGLIHPSDLTAWRRWQTRRRGVRGMIGVVRARRHPEATGLRLARGGDHPAILIAVESASPSQQAALLAPLRHLPLEDVAVLLPESLTVPLPEHPWRTAPVTDLVHDPALGDVSAVLAVGHFLPAGAAAHDLARARRLPFGVIQHGLLVPMAPPLPPAAHLLSWSRADGEFWTSGRTDVTVEVVGSQLLREATVADAERLARDRMIEWAARRPIYLGQLHGAEIGRRRMVRAAERTIRRTNARYRPHPQETDLLSRLVHRWWTRQGITFDRSGLPLPRLEAPVIGVFSTGILEAAARGLPAWVDFDRPPAWLGEFWERYGMSRLGGQPTAPPATSVGEPSAAVARWLLRAAGVTNEGDR